LKDEKPNSIGHERSWKETKSYTDP